MAYSFVDRLEPIAVNVSVEETLVDAGVAQRFASRSVFVWHLDLIPDEPPLELRNATVGGFLNADSLPTSDLPPLSGTMSGCLSPTAADAVFIPTLSKTLREFLEGCSPLDCSTTNAGDADGWTLEFRWQAEVVTIRDGEIL